jgi:dethiobiotin synthase
MMGTAGTRDLFVTGTDTNVGKTVLSALLVAALDGIYWKPIQTGVSEGTDRETVVRWADIPEERTAPECYTFDPPVSPHLAAEWAGATIDLKSIRRPQTAAGKPLIAEGAGGVLVPVNNSQFMLDLIVQLGLPVVIASRSALGTINHSTLTVRELRRAGATVKGVVMIGHENKDNERAVEKYAAVPILGRIPFLDSINRRALLQVFDLHFDRKYFS